MTQKYLDRLVTAYPCITEVWLIGSRANGTSRPDSDWDYLVWSDDDSLLSMLSRAPAFHDPNVDLLIVINDDGFLKPWLESDGSRKHGNVYKPVWEGGLNWQPTSGTRTEYTEAKETGGTKPKAQVRDAVLRYRR